MAAIALLGGVAVWLLAAELFPYHSINHDEGVYLQQAAMLLEGRLRLHPPVDGLFRPWFFVDAGDALYPKYAPVPAAMFAPGLAVGLPRLVLAALAAAALALVAATVAEAFDRRTGLLAAVLVLASPVFLLPSSVFLPYVPTAVLTWTFAWAYLRADRTGSRRWAAVAGVAVGLAAFARPFTAALFAAPFVAHAVWTLGLAAGEAAPPPRDGGTAGAGEPATGRSRRAVRRALHGARRRASPSRLRRWAEAVARSGALHRQLPVAAGGLAGVTVALAYNAVLTGDPFVFPYQAFGPEDGPGFGHRALLGHGVEYTVGLGLETSARVLRLFATDWLAGGLLTVAAAALGAAVAVRRDLDARGAALLGVAPSVAVGNVAFWGNYNLLGDLDRAGDGLVSLLGPYYHVDLLLPTAAFAAVGALAATDWVRARLARSRLDPAAGRAVLAAALLATAGVAGATTAADLDRAIERNAAVTDGYETAYAPFGEARSGGGLDAPSGSALVVLHRTYGPWLNHPYQALRNGAGFDGETVYALSGRPFALADAFPDRQRYRYGIRGAWAPPAGSPDAARLQRVRSATGERLRLDATLGVPSGAESVTLRVAHDEYGDGDAPAESGGYYVGTPSTGEMDVTVVLEDGEARLVGGDGAALDGPAGRDGTSNSGSGTRRLVPVGEPEPVPVPDRGAVVLTAFVDYGAGGGFTYRLELPVETAEDVAAADGKAGLRALTPSLEHCRRARDCDGAATYVPDASPNGVSMDVALAAAERNH